VTDPNVIFADEPTGNLDSESGLQVMEILDSLHEKGRTVIVVTHETQTAEFANRIIRIKDGKVESDNPITKDHLRSGALK
jgi:putative ABC transport system ATP-binding protein